MASLVCTELTDPQDHSAGCEAWVEIGPLGLVPLTAAEGGQVLGLLLVPIAIAWGFKILQHTLGVRS